MPKRAYGSGRIYKLKGRKTWMLRYFVDGKRYVESSGTRDREEAKNILDKRIEAKRTHRIAGAGKVTFEDLAQFIVEDYRRKNRKTTSDLERRIRHLAGTFKKKRALSVGAAEIEGFIARRLQEGASNSEVNRELSVLRRMYSLGVQRGAIDSVPPISGHFLPEPPPRSGFFEPEEFRAVLARLPGHLRPPVHFAYLTGWRLQEILGLQWSQVDLVGGSINLSGADTKNRTPRRIYMEGQLLALVDEQWHDHLDGWQSCPFVFHSAGQRIRDPRHAWKRACFEAGFGEKYRDEPGRTRYRATKLLHDFRHTGVRNLVRSGVTESVAMTMVGHRTRAMLDRYNITGDRDLREAAEKQEQYQRELDRQMVGSPMCTEMCTGDQTDFEGDSIKH